MSDLRSCGVRLRREIRAAAVRQARDRAFILDESGERVTWRRMRRLRREARRELRGSQPVRRRVQGSGNPETLESAGRCLKTSPD